MIYLNAQDNASALREFSTAISLNPEEQGSYIGRGMIEVQSRNFDAAITDLAHAAGIAPSSTAYIWLGRALEGKGDFENAARAYGKAVRLAPEMAEARDRLNALRAKTGH